VDHARLENVEKYVGSNQMNAAVATLADKPQIAIRHIRTAMVEDKTFRFRAAEWPIFVDLRSNPDFISAIKV
jgi:hypothetical protein